jgi:hypothetical protein
LPVCETAWRGLLLLTEAGQLRGVPFQGRHLRLRYLADRTDVVALVDGLRGGVPLPSAPGTAHVLPRLRRTLGLPPGSPFPLGTCQDPRLLRIGMEVCHRRVPPEGADSGIAGFPVTGGPPLALEELPDAAERLGEPLALVYRVHELDSPPGAGQRRWVAKGDSLVAMLYRTAGANGGVATADLVADVDWRGLLRAARTGLGHEEWTRTPRRLELAPCPHCRSFRRMTLRIREATEPVCLDCERDTTGIPWPLAGYGQWLLGGVTPG